jgi:DNA-binding NarL/FixJ family response regulator
MLVAMTLRCVIVDDSPQVLRAASNLLRGEGIEIAGVAASTRRALEIVDETRPDVVLVDIDLGPESGFALAHRLAETLDTAAARVILISTHDEADFEDLIAASPAIGFLSKSKLSGAAIRRLVEGRSEERY